MAKRIPSPQPQHETPPQGAASSPYPTTLIQFTQLPDKTAYVDLVSAQIFNENRAAIRDINRELGVDLKGNCYDLHDRLSRVIDPDGRLILPETVFSVGKQNADFTTIQAAIDSIDDASPSKLYTVNIYPGTYEETIVLKPNITLKAFLQLPIIPNGPYLHPVIIQPPSGQCVQLTEAGNYLFDGIYFKPSANKAFDHAPTYSTTCNLYFSNCIVNTAETPSVLLSDHSLINYDFRNSVIMASNRASHVLRVDGPDVYRTTFKAVNSYVRGVLAAEGDYPEEFKVIFNKSFLEGKIYTEVTNLWLSSYDSKLFNQSAPVFDLKASDGSLLESINSLFYARMYTAEFETHDGSSRPIIETQGSHYLHEKPTSYEVNDSYGNNFFGSSLMPVIEYF